MRLKIGTTMVFSGFAILGFYLLYLLWTSAPIFVSVVATLIYGGAAIRAITAMHD